MAYEPGRDFIKRYGADPSGVRDSAPALQDMFDDKPRGGEVLQLPPGLFKLSTEVSKNATGESLILRGHGPATQLFVEMEEYEDAITINNTPGGGVCGLESLAFVGPQALDSEAALDTPACYRPIVLGGTFGAPLLRRVGFYGVYAKGAVAYLGNGAVNALVEFCDWEGCVASGTTSVDPQSLLDCNIIFGATVRSCRFTSIGYFAEQQLTGGSCRQAVRFRHYDVREGSVYTASQARITGCYFYTPGQMMISTIEPNGGPNGPTSPIFTTDVTRAYGFMTPPTHGKWNRPTGTPTGGYTQEYTFQIRIDGTGTPGVATWSTRFENAGFGGGFTAWTSHGAVANATVNGITFTMTPAETFTAGQVYQCYVTGNARMRQLLVERCQGFSGGGLSTFGVLAADVDRLLIDQFDFDASSQAYAVQMYGVDVAKIIQPSVRGHKIRAEPAGYGYGANAYVYIEDRNSDAVLELSNATAWKTSDKGVEATGP